MIYELLFPLSILAVEPNRRTLVIMLETEIYIYDISNMRLLHAMETTEGAFALPPMGIVTLTKLQPSALFPLQRTALTLPALHPCPPATPLSSSNVNPNPLRRLHPPVQRRYLAR